MGAPACLLLTSVAGRGDEPLLPSVRSFIGLVGPSGFPRSVRRAFTIPTGRMHWPPHPGPLQWHRVGVLGQEGSGSIFLFGLSASR
jgi:hypothetical protein